MTIDATQIHRIAARLGYFAPVQSEPVEAARNESAGPVRIVKRRMHRNLPIKRGDYPPGDDGRRQYELDYHRAWRRAIGFKRIGNMVPVLRRDYPNTDEGKRAYRKDYNAAYRKMKGI